MFLAKPANRALPQEGAQVAERRFGHVVAEVRRPSPQRGVDPGAQVGQGLVRCRPLGSEQLSRVVDRSHENCQAATFSSCVVASSSVTFTPSLNFTPSSTSLISSWPLNRRQRSWAVTSSL